jgi:hypothetical protein
MAAVPNRDEIDRVTRCLQVIAHYTAWQILDVIPELLQFQIKDFIGLVELIEVHQHEVCLKAGNQLGEINRPDVTLAQQLDGKSLGPGSRLVYTNPDAFFCGDMRIGMCCSKKKSKISSSPIFFIPRNFQATSEGAK